MMQLTQIVKHLLIINILVYLGTMALPREYFALYYPGSEHFHPWQIIISMFMHGSPSHLLFNMLSLFFIGPFMENRLGSKRFLIFYLASGIGGSILHLLVQYYQIQYQGMTYLTEIPVLGASGAINGLFIGLAYLYPDLEMMLLFLPIPIKAKYMAIAMVALDFVYGVTGTQPGIAHFAHLGGALFGLLLIIYWTKYR
ncbi:MAG: rhomboid family intramembrane serine protease [Saprospiraceae bacterium]|nr:rhomboid family intramembrane serine protease [Saprospiraceae bacterium]MBL0260959.1 rhomboid family intramembrane serine protease [Saprospiraceae bacterium]